MKKTAAVLLALCLCLPLFAVGAWLFFCDHPLPDGDVRTPKTSSEGLR